MKKRIILLIISVGVFTTSFFYTSGDKSASNIQNQEINNLLGKELFMEKCKGCHGKKGTWFLMAKKLSTSTKTVNEAVKIITNGKGSMPSFKDRLSVEQIASLAKFVQTLKEN